MNEVKEIKLLDTLKESLYFFFSHFKTICFIVLPLTIPLETLSYYAEEAESEALFGIVIVLNLVVLLVYYGGIIFFIASVSANAPISIIECYKKALKFCFRLICIGLLIGILGFLLGSVTVQLADLLSLDELLIDALMMIIAFYIFVRLSFVPFNCLLQNKGVSASMGDGFKQTSACQKILLLGALPFAAFIFLLDLGLTSPTVAAFELSAFIDHIIITPLITAFFTIFTYNVYCHSMNMGGAIGKHNPTKRETRSAFVLEAV